MDNPADATSNTTSSKANTVSSNFGITADAVRVEDTDRSKDQRLSLDPENAEKGLAQLVLTLIELLRQLLEKQALRRMEAGQLTEEQIERMGTTFAQLQEKMDEFLEYFELTKEDLNINLGPLGDLL